MRRLFTIVLSCFILTAFTGTRLFAQSIAVNEEEALVLANEIERTVNNGDASVLNNLFYMPSFLNLIKTKSTEIKKQPPAFLEGFASTFTMNTFGNLTAKNIKNGSYKLLRNYQSDNRRHLLFRMFGTGGLNYHDFTLIKVKDSIKADDMLAYITGDDMSNMIVNFLNTSLHNQEPDKVPEDLRSLTKMKNLKAQGKFSEVISLYKTLSVQYKNNKDLKIIYISACQQTDKNLYKAALEEYAALFPTSPNIYLLMLDSYYLDKQYDKGLDAIDKLDSLVKGDPFLDYYRANFNIAGGNFKKAKEFYRNVLRYAPNVTTTIRSLVRLYMQDEEVEEAKAAITSYKKGVAFNQNYIDELYHEFPALKSNGSD